jgi:HTH-type transcriptional regulator/antitoxin HigA
MKISISKEWLLKRAHLEEGLEIGAGGPLLESGKGSSAIDWSQFPVKEMYKRNWFEGFTGSLAAATSQREYLLEVFLKHVTPLKALQRQRVRIGSEANPYALLAWQCRALQLAELSPPKKEFSASTIDDDWLNALARLSRFADGPARTKKHLSDAGIALVIEPRLQSTHLDGAALLGKDFPVVGLTLRHDRLDNFWFVLMHEIIHVKKHLKRGRVEDIFDERLLDNGDETLSDIEREADELAGKALISDELWNTCLARFVRSEESVKSFAEELKISPAVVAGRIRHEAGNWTILRNLVGQGQVRKHFPEISFGD